MNSVVPFMMSIAIICIILIALHLKDKEVRGKTKRGEDLLYRIDTNVQNISDTIANSGDLTLLAMEDVIRKSRSEYKSVSSDVHKLTLNCDGYNRGDIMLLNNSMNRFELMLLILTKCHIDEKRKREEQHSFLDSITK